MIDDDELGELLDQADKLLADGFDEAEYLYESVLMRVSSAVQLAQAIHMAFRRLVGGIGEWQDHQTERMLSTLWNDTVTGKRQILDWMDEAQNLWGDGLNGALSAAMEPS